MSIIREDAVVFIRDKLGIEDIENRALDLHLLNRIVRCLQSELPFQNLMLYKTPPERRFPTAEEVVNLGMSLAGGICFHNNWFTSMLLEAIGYDVYTIIGTFITYPDFKYDHPMIVVRGLHDPDDRDQKHTLFLVDVGTGYPTPGCVPLHRLPFKFPVTAGFEYRFTRDGDLYYRLHRSRVSSADSNSTPHDIGWTKKVSFTLIPCELSTAKGSAEMVSETEPPSTFMRLLRIFRWPKDNDDRIVAIRGQELVQFGPAKNNINGNNLENLSIKIELDDLEETILKYFPNFDPVDLKEALPFAMEITNLTCGTN